MVLGLMVLGVKLLGMKLFACMSLLALCLGWTLGWSLLKISAAVV